MKFVQNIFVTFYSFTLSKKVNFPEQKEALIDLCGMQATNVLDKYFLKLK